MLRKIRSCFRCNSVLYSRHAKVEMETEEFGGILEHGVCEAIVNGEVIENYPDVKLWSDYRRRRK